MKALVDQGPKLNPLKHSDGLSRWTTGRFWNVVAHEHQKGKTQHHHCTISDWTVLAREHQKDETPHYHCAISVPLDFSGERNGEVD